MKNANEIHKLIILDIFEIGTIRVLAKNCKFYILLFVFPMI